MNITDTDCEKLSIAIARAMQQARSVSDSEHYDHHRWISQRIKADEARREFWEKMLEHATRWGVLSALSAAGYAGWLWFKALVKAAA